MNESKLDGPLFVSKGADAPHPDLPFVEREAVAAIVYDPATDKFLGLRWSNGWETFITGGPEGNQTAEEAARMEITEETGYINLKLVKVLPRCHSKFFHGPKGVNRFAHFTSFLFELAGPERLEVSAEEQKKHKSVWLSREELKHFKLAEALRFLYNSI